MLKKKPHWTWLVYVLDIATHIIDPPVLILALVLGCTTRFLIYQPVRTSVSPPYTVFMPG